MTTTFDKNDRHAADSPASHNCTLQDDLDWLEAFQSRHGRPLRVLHMGNIAGNAYLNAKFLRTVGIEADVISPDYTHVMGRTEWEDVELRHGHGSDFAPSFDSSDLIGYSSPSWYATGSLAACVAQIEALYKRTRGVRALAATLRWLERHLPPPLASFGSYLILFGPLTVTKKLLSRFADYGAQTLPKSIKKRLRQPYRTLLRTLDATDRALTGIWRKLRAGHEMSLEQQASYDASLLAKFAEFFPNRSDRLSLDDLRPHTSLRRTYSRLFRHYDVVQTYATHPITALVADKKPYVAFEHGTLRTFTMSDDPLHRLTALSYRMANHTFITNGDCLAYAKRLGIESYSPIIHPIDVEQHRRDYGTAIDDVRREIGGDIILFCPTRHDWDIKGTDRFIRALPLIKKRVLGNVRLLLVDWGQQVDDSKHLLEELGCVDDVVWRRSMCRVTMIKHIRAADIVFDQMVLPVFGSTAPQAISAGKPVIGSYVPNETRWLIPEPAPILPAYSPQEVADAVVMALDPDWRREYEHRARHWVDTYHHPNVVIREHLRIYRRALGEAPRPQKRPLTTSANGSRAAGHTHSEVARASSSQSTAAIQDE